MADDQDPGGASRSKSPLIALLLLTNSIATGFIAYLQFKAHEREMHRPNLQDVVKAQLKEINPELVAEEGEDADKASSQSGIVMPLEPFTANLAQGEGPRRYLRLEVVLKFSNSSKEEEFKSKQPQIRDTIISILNSKRAEDILKLEGKELLKEEIKSSINSFLIDSQIVDIFYVGLQIN
jgi:flagellar FliL protein